MFIIIIFCMLFFATGYAIENNPINTLVSSHNVYSNYQSYKIPKNWEVINYFKEKPPVDEVYNYNCYDNDLYKRRLSFLFKRKDGYITSLSIKRPDEIMDNHIKIECFFDFIKSGILTIILYPDYLKIKDKMETYNIGLEYLNKGFTNCSDYTVSAFLEILYENQLIPDFIVDTILEQVNAVYPHLIYDFRLAAAKIIAIIEPILSDNWSEDTFNEHLLTQINLIEDQQRRDKIIGDIITALYEAEKRIENSKVIITLCQQMTIIPAETASRCLELMLYALPPQEICISLISKQCYLNQEPKCAQMLQRLYSLILDKGKICPTSSKLAIAQTPAQLFAQSLFMLQHERESWQQERKEKDEEIARLRLVLAEARKKAEPEK